MDLMERMALGKELSALMLEQKSAEVLRRMIIGRQIVEVMVKLGLGANAQAATGQEPEGDVPQVVKDFLAGLFVGLPQMKFLDKLREISVFLGTHLTVEQVREQTGYWVRKAGLVL